MTEIKKKKEKIRGNFRGKGAGRETCLALASIDVTLQEKNRVFRL